MELVENLIDVGQCVLIMYLLWKSHIQGNINIKAHEIMSDLNNKK